MIPKCQSCNQEMTLSKDFENKSDHNKKYRVRRFTCLLCDVQETVFTGGYREELVKSYKEKTREV